jgi:circadian clock protein KaiC
MGQKGAGGAASVAAAKAPTGVQGFDAISRGGLPRGRTSLVIGTPGAGKTIFALQSLVHGAEELGQAGIFVAFEESSRQVVANGGVFGWDLPRLESSRLFFLDAYLSPQVVQAGEFDLAGMLAGLEARVRQMGAERIVFDGLDVLLNLLGDPVAERREVYRIHEWSQRNGLTAIITAKSTFAEPFSTEPWGFLQYMADCVVVLHHRIVERVALRGARIVKYRGSSFSANEFPLVIGPRGVEIATFGPDELDFEVSSQRVSTGVPRLDEMLGGGYFRGSSILVTGAPGTAKTTLGAAFAAATCAAGEGALYVSFDEPARQIIRNMKSVGIDLQRQVDSGRLHMYSVRTEVRSAEEHLVVLGRLIRELRPASMVIDPVSALRKSGGQLAAVDTSIRLLDLARASGVTTLCASLVEDFAEERVRTSMQISTIADTWMHVEYALEGGERNRSLSIVKSRGMAHSNQVRELVLSGDGVSLTDVYVEGGEVLMGTARFEKEAAVAAEETRLRREVELRRGELERQKAELESQLKRLQRELHAHDSRLSDLVDEQRFRRRHKAQTREQLHRRRSGTTASPESPAETDGDAAASRM